MNPAFVVRFRAEGPWRIGPATGARNRVDRIFHSDSLFSAVTHAMARLGRLEDWLAATAANPQGPAVRFSSCFPFVDQTLFVVPPKNLWPPPPSAKVRWKSARFVPLQVAAALAGDEPVKDAAWFVDGPSECLLPNSGRIKTGPFKAALRSHAAVDRLRGDTVEVHDTACLEFAPNAGFWAVAVFADEAAAAEWNEPVRAALRLLADSGMGGERSIGWGRSADPEFSEGGFPELILKSKATEAETPVETGYWLLSLFSPGASDAIDWQRGAYSLAMRGGRVDSPAGSGEEKKVVRMVEEGSVLVSEAPPAGSAPDVAPDGFQHPVFRAGFALAIPIPLRAAERPPVSAS